MIPYNAAVLAGMFSFATNIRSINKKYFVPHSAGRAGAMKSFVMGTGIAMTFFFGYGAGICGIFSINPYKFYYEKQAE